jgi:hypothetical protein
MDPHIAAVIQLMLQYTNQMALLTTWRPNNHG